MRTSNVLYILSICCISGCSPEVKVNLPPELAAKLAGDDGLKDLIPVVLDALGNNKPVQSEEIPVEEPESVDTPTDGVTDDTVVSCEGVETWQEHLQEFPYHPEGYVAHAKASYRMYDDGRHSCDPSDLVVEYTSSPNSEDVRARIRFSPSVFGYESFQMESYDYAGRTVVDVRVHQGTLGVVNQWHYDPNYTFRSVDHAEDGTILSMLPQGPFEKVIVQIAFQGSSIPDTDAFEGDQDSFSCDYTRIIESDTFPVVWPPKIQVTEYPACSQHLEYRAANVLFTGVQFLGKTTYSHYELTTFDEQEREVEYHAFGYDGLENEQRLTYYDQNGTDYAVCDGKYCLAHDHVVIDADTAWYSDSTSLLATDGTRTAISSRISVKGIVREQVEYAERFECKNTLDCSYQLFDPISPIPLVRIAFVQVDAYRTEARVFDGQISLSSDIPTEVFETTYHQLTGVVPAVEYWRYTKASDGYLRTLYRQDQGGDIQGYTRFYTYDSETLIRTHNEWLDGTSGDTTEYEYLFLGKL